MNQKDTKLKEIIRELAAEFFSRESNRQSLITITDVEMGARNGKATILMTVLPEEKEEQALDFAHRQLTDFKHFVMEKSRIGHIPFFEVRIDKGEKNRQKIDEIERGINSI
jgi:ribosome-binding factor A